MTTQRPKLNDPTLDGSHAVRDLIDQLQRGGDAGEADTYDSMFADDILWGTPKGMVLQGYSNLNPIHRRMMAGPPVVPPSRFELAQAACPAPGVTVAQIRRSAIDGGFSEMAMYVLVRNGEKWWVAAAQNTPVVDALPST
ncbi:SgcJ/EcaC family oxidoreductase [Mycolicibacterium setense]